MTQKEKILNAFKYNNPMCNYDLNKICFRYSARIYDLQQDGYVFETWIDKQDRTKFWWKLKGKREV